MEDPKNDECFIPAYDEPRPIEVLFEEWRKTKKYPANVTESRMLMEELGVD